MHPSRPVLRHRLRLVFRGIETTCIAVLLAASVVYAGSKAVGADLNVSTEGSPAVTRTLGELLGDVVTGRVSWTPTLTWSMAVVALSVFLTVTAVVSVRRRGRTSVVRRRAAQRCDPLGAGVGQYRGSVTSAG